jgi:hypothetical protein
MNFKKLQTVTLASVFTAVASMPAMSVINMDIADNSLNYSNEIKGTVDANGRIEVTAAGTELNVQGTADFAVDFSTDRYYRFDLTGAAFEGTISLAQLESVASSGAASVDTIAGALQSGGDDETFAIFKVTTTASTDLNDIATDSVWTLTVAKFDLDPTVTATIKYATYETVAEAANQLTPLSTKTANVAQFISGAVYANVVEASDVTATVASGFTSFDNPDLDGDGVVDADEIVDGTLASLGKIDSADVILTAAAAANDTLTIAGATSAAADYITAAQTITVTGDVSVGVFTSQTTAACAGTAIACVAATDNGSCTIASTGTAVAQYICVELGAITAGTTLAKGAYTIGFATETGLDGSLGSVVYDTTSVEIPYITTYEGYNQRIFLDNRGTTAAYYSTTFTTEDGVTAVSGASGTGTLAAGEMTTIRASDLVTFTGGTRGTATIEVEAQTTSLKVTTQIVDIGTGMTDTILLHPSTQQ